MTLNEYQERAMSTCMESSNNSMYILLNLIGEFGEYCSKLAKCIRKGQLVINDNKLCWMIDPTEIQEALNFEKGDILWQLAGLIKVQGNTLEEIAQMNLDKYPQDS